MPPFYVVRACAKRNNKPSALSAAAHFKQVDFSMSEAIRSIVDGYLSLKDRTALEELRAHRQRLRKRLQDQPKSWVDSSSTIRVLDEDLDVIEAALRRF
jgi:hypothetical protein